MVAGRLVPTGFFAGSRQNEILTALINKHLQDGDLLNFAKSEDFHITTTERGIHRYQHEHLIAALDTLNTYQRNRKAQCSKYYVSPSMNRRYTSDPRTRLVELLKRWLRTHAENGNLEEDEVRRVERLCRDLLNHAEVFPARNNRSFIHTITDVYGHMQWQLREVLGRDRSCADLVDRALVLAKNLLSDSISFLLMGPTDLKQTDTLPSTEAVALWGALPPDVQAALPTRADEKLQKATTGAWATSCGAVVAALLSAPEAVRLFGGRSGREAKGVAIGGTKAIADGQPGEVQDLVTSRVAKAREDFANNKFRHSGFAGPFRKTERYRAREAYLEAAMAIFHLAFLLGGAFTQFRVVGDGMGDYGMIRMAPWLHPFLKALEQKVMQLKSSLEALNAEVEDALVLAKSRGVKVESPVPTQRMCSRAHEAIDRAIIGKENHAAALLIVLEKLRARSAPERLPKVIDSLNDACVQLQAALTSDEFRMHVGDASFDEFPKLDRRVDVTDHLFEASPQPRLAVADAPAERCVELDSPFSGAGALAEVSPHYGKENEYPDAGMQEDQVDDKIITYSDIKADAPCLRAASPDPVPEVPGGCAALATAEDGGRRSLDINRVMRDMSPIRVGSTGVSLLDLGRLVGASPWRQGSAGRSSSASASSRCSSRSPSAPPPGEAPQVGDTLGSDPASGTVAAPAAEVDIVVDGLAVEVEVGGDAGNPFTSGVSEEVDLGAGNPFTPEAPKSPSKVADLTGDCAARDARNPFEAGDADPPSSDLSAPEAKARREVLAGGAGGERPADRSPSPAPADDKAEERPRADSNTGVMRAIVYRCTSVTTGFKRHDRRQIWISEGRLHICFKNSMTNTKSIVDLSREVDECQLVQGNIITLWMRRQRGRRADAKIYFFEFMDGDIAARFKSEIQRSVTQ